MPYTPWTDVYLDRPTRIYVSAFIFFITLLLSLIAGNDAAFAYAIIAQLIPSRPPAWLQPVLDSLLPYLGPIIVEQPPAPVRRILRSIGIRN